MKNKIREGRQNMVILIMNIAIVALSILMVISGFAAVGNLREDFSFTYSEESMYYMVDSGDFYRMVEAYHRNTQEGSRGSSAMGEYYGVARYYEAASLYRAFLEAGDAERAERQKERMAEAREEMGSWAMVEEEIQTQLGIDGI